MAETGQGEGAVTAEKWEGEGAVAAEKGEGAVAVAKGDATVVAEEAKGAVPATGGTGKVPVAVAAAAAGGKTVRVKTNDKKIIELPEEEAKLFKAIRDMIEDGCADGIVPLPNVHSEVLTRAIEYCKKHVPDDDGGDADDVAGWDEAFVGGLDDDGLYDLMLAAHYLNLTALLDLTCKAFADKVKSAKTPEQIRTMFNITSDFTAAEEAEIRDELAWASGD